MPREFKTILCPTDFSDESYRAMQYAERFAKQYNSKLILAHVIHVPSGELRNAEGHMMKLEDGKQHTADQLKEAHAKYAHGYPNCEQFVDFGVPAEKLLALARERNVDLIVISTHGHSAFEHILVGSVAEGIITHAPCPVFIVRRGAE
jgi:universal stress protein A